MLKMLLRNVVSTHLDEDSSNNVISDVYNIDNNVTFYDDHRKEENNDINYNIDNELPVFDDHPNGENYDSDLCCVWFV